MFVCIVLVTAFDICLNTLKLNLKQLLVIFYTFIYTPNLFIICVFYLESSNKIQMSTTNSQNESPTTNVSLNNASPIKSFPQKTESTTESFPPKDVETPVESSN